MKNLNGDSKYEAIIKLIDYYAPTITNIPKEKIEQFKRRYLSDKRSYDEIEREIISIIQKINMMENLVNGDVDQDILSNSVILIGPMGSGKSTIANLLCRKYNMPHLSLDSREQLSMLYQQRDKFSDFKEFEFFLTGTVLTSIREPMIIDFGAGHSIYENEAMFLEMKSLLSKFSNVVLLMPSEDKEESIAILNERKGIKSRSSEDYDNRHFINMPCNYELANITEYTKDKLPEQITDEIIKQVSQNQMESAKVI